MNWFDSSDDVVIQPERDRAKFWRRKYGTERIKVARQTLFVNNGLGRLFDAVCREFDGHAEAVHDHREQGYCHFRNSTGAVTVYRAPEPAPYAAADLEWLISAGAQQIVFVNGSGSLWPDVPVGSLILPGELIREEGTSFHYAPPDVCLRTTEKLNERIRQTAIALDISLGLGKHWTIDAIYRETWAKVARYRDAGVVSVDMELSALAGVAHYRQCQLSALLVVTDVLSEQHTWEGTTSDQFRQGIERAARIAAHVFF